MYYNDHDPPHFHVKNGGHEALFRIADLQLINGSLPPGMEQAVRAWARPRQGALAQAWVKARSGIPLGVL